MKFHIPFTLSKIERLRKKKIIFSSFIKHKKKSSLEEYLKNADVNLTREQYLNIVIRTFITSFFIIFIFSGLLLFFLKIELFYLFALGLAVVFSGFLSFSQLLYPKVYTKKREKEIDKNLIPALQDMLIQLTSGIPLFNILINISSSNYGELSIEFKKAVRKINAGISQVIVLEEMAKKNSSLFFRRAIWQISNGMKAGSDIGIVIRESVKALNEEQLIQIQKYGNKLNPLIMFYMLISVIMPALSITFLTLISSLVGMPGRMVILLYLGMFVFVILLQIMFLGTIKSARPSLL